MRKTSLVAMLLVAACAATPQGREVQMAVALKTANQTAATAVEAGVISPDQAEEILRVTTKARKALQRAIVSRRAGEPLTVWQHLIALVEDYLLDAQLKINGGS